jgi:hypothetical protein
MHRASERLRRLFGGDANGFAGFDVYERRSHLPPVAKLQSALAEAAAGYDSDRIGGAAINLDKSYQPLSVFALRIFNPKFLESKHGKTYAQHLPGTQVTVSLFRVAKIFVERFQMQLSALSFQFGLFSAPAGAFFTDLDDDARCR